MKMKYDIETFIKEYNYETRRKHRFGLLKIEKLPILKRMKYLLHFIAYFLDYTYKNNIKIRYSTYDIPNPSRGIFNQTYMARAHNIHFQTPEYYCILEIGKDMDNNNAFVMLSIRLFKNDMYQTAVATESITLDIALQEAYESELNAESTKIKNNLLTEEFLAWFYVQGFNIAEVL